MTDRFDPYRWRDRDREPSREDAELALMAAVEDDRIEGLSGHELAIDILTILAEGGWLLLPRGRR